MTVSELYSSVAALGFERGLESDGAFLLAANRAILQVSTVRPERRSCRISHFPPRNVALPLVYDTFSVKPGTPVVFEAENARAFCFRIQGYGVGEMQYFNSGEWVTLYSSVMAEGETVKGFARVDGEFREGRFRLVFRSDTYSFLVGNVAMYDTSVSEREEDIPLFAPACRYDLSALVPDFLSIEEVPMRQGVRLSSYRREYDIEAGRVLLLPYEASGEYQVVYRHRPREIEPAPIGETLATSRQTIDLDEELASLLPYLVSFFIWLDDEPEKANAYYEIYRARAEALRAEQRNFKPAPYRSTNGW